MTEKIVKLLLVSCCVLFSISLFSQEINSEKLAEHIKFLSSDALAGRKPGTSGDKAAAKYIQEELRKNSTKMLGDDGLQAFEVVAEIKLGSDNTLSFAGQSAVPEKDFMPLSFSENLALEAEVVFVGYGFDIESDSLMWKDYRNVDVTGRWVMMFQADPEMDNPDSKFIEFSGTRQKAMIARDKGAAGILLVKGKMLSSEDVVTPLFFDKSASGAGLPIINITRELANKLLLTSDTFHIENLESKLKNTGCPFSFSINTNVKATVNVVKQKNQTYNVVALIEGSDPILKNEYIVIGGHYDHLGMGGQGSDSRMPDTIAVHNGADDNASGVAGMLEVARSINSSKTKPKRSVVCIAFGAEEMGLLGSGYFVKNPLVKLQDIKGMINLDMIGRLNDSTRAVAVGGTGSSVEAEPLLDKLVELHSPTGRMKLSFSKAGYGPSDHASFYAENIPVFFFSTGAHEDYHMPGDDYEKINIRGEKDLLSLINELVVSLANRDSVLTFQEAGPKMRNSQGRYKITFGVIPDFAQSSEDGLAITGVKKDGPAERAGMLKGDKIIGINGKSVKNIYDYMYRLKELEKGKAASVDIIRNNEEMIMILQL